MVDDLVAFERHHAAAGPRGFDEPTMEALIRLVQRVRATSLPADTEIPDAHATTIMFGSGGDEPHHKSP
jgi:hypothetical protein